MLLIPTALEPRDGDRQTRSTPVVWTWLALVLALFTIERLVMIDHDLGLGMLPRELFAGVTFVVASWSLYSDPALFDLWQLWTHVLVHPSVWLLALEVALMLVVGRAVERAMGSLTLAACLASLAPLAGISTLLVGPPEVMAGGLPLLLGVLGLGLGRFPGASVRWGVAYWAVVVVGHVPLFVLPLRTMAIVVLILSVWLAPVHATVVTAVASVVVLLAGAGLGAASRRFVQPAPTT
jgi:membrane associated rhomboid family serine protease